MGVYTGFEMIDINAENSSTNPIGAALSLQQWELLRFLNMYYRMNLKVPIKT